ncbi:MAG: RNA polymerase sigma factor [Coprobacillaceae bacterium]
METEELSIYIKSACKGDVEALEKVILEVQDLIFNLSLRMLGDINDAQDASQEIVIKIMTKLSTFRFESKFKTWAYRVATNYLIDYKKICFQNIH